MAPRLAPRRYAPLSCALALIALTAACSGSMEGSESKAGEKQASRHAAAGVVSREHARGLLDRYVSVNNRANKSRDGKLLSTVEGGALLEQSKADYKQSALASTKEKAEYGEPFYYVDRRYFIPRKGKASWFAVSARIKDDDGKSRRPVLLVFDREEKEPWKLVASVQAPKGRNLAPATDEESFLRSVPASARQGDMAPDQLKAALTRLYTKREVAASGFKPNKLARAINKSARDAADGVGEGGRMHWMSGGYAAHEDLRDEDPLGADARCLRHARGPDCPRHRTRVHREPERGRAGLCRGVRSAGVFDLSPAPVRRAHPGQWQAHTPGQRVQPHRL